MTSPMIPNVTHVVTLNEHNFLVKTLNRNPLQVDVMEVAQLIQKLNDSAKGVIDKINADEVAKQKLLDDFAKAQADAAAEAAKPPAEKTAVADAAAAAVDAGEPA